MNKIRTGKIMLLSALFCSVFGMGIFTGASAEPRTRRSASADRATKDRVRTGADNKVRTAAQGIVTQGPVGQTVVDQGSLNQSAHIATVRRDGGNVGAIRHQRPVHDVRRTSRHDGRGDGYYGSRYSNYGIFVPEVSSTVIFSDDDTFLTLQEALDRIALLRREIYTLREEIISLREQLGR